MSDIYNAVTLGSTEIITAATLRRISGSLAGMVLAALLIFSAAPRTAMSQTGPAGIGNSATNVLWLRSDQGTTTTTGGETVQEWEDISGNDSHVSQTEETRKPEMYPGSSGFPDLPFGEYSIH